MTAPAHRTTLRHRYARQVALIAALLLACAALIEGAFGFRQAREQMASRQAVLARAAANEIEAYLDNVAAGLRQVQALPWGTDGFGDDRRREELHRLLALHPALIEVRDLDARGQERLFVSRTALDRRGGAAPSAPGTGNGPALGYGAPRFDDEGVPNVGLTLALTGVGAATHATINLRFLAEVVSSLRTDDGSRIYVVDADGLLIAHPEPTLVLKQMTAQTHSPVAATRQVLARQAGASGVEVTSVTATDGPGLTGEDSVTTALPLGRTGWLALVEQSRDAALAPALATLWRMFWLALAGGGVALAVGWWWAKRMSAPISRLRAATAQLAAGQWHASARVDTGDEIEALAEDFESMARRLQDSYRELEAKVEARTLELRQRRDEAERANAAKTRFLAAASHDLRQPMHAIGLLIGLLRARVAEPAAQSLAEKAQQASCTMESLFGTLLDISRLDAGTVSVREETVRLADTLERAVTAYAPLAAAKGVALRARATALCVRTDAALLDRIVGNLVVNAIRYTECGGVLLACRARDGRAVVSVFDTGIGIAPEHAALIFEEFVRINPTTAGDEGLGLGLSIVRRTADLLGLTVNVASRLGRGSRFDVVLGAPVSAAPLASATAPLAIDHTRLRGLFVLAVDDDAESLRASAALLEQAGCLVATASDGESALAEARRHLRAPDLLLTDLRFGGPRALDGNAGDNGLNLIGRLRAQLGETIPAVLLTADTDCTGAGVDALTVLHKPAGMQAMLHALTQAAAGRGTDVPPTAPPA
jgi:signal transduction histidine kinase/CheY-like chemotaxis protein